LLLGFSNNDVSLSYWVPLTLTTKTTITCDMTPCSMAYIYIHTHTHTYMYNTIYCTQRWFWRTCCLIRQRKLFFFLVLLVYTHVVSCFSRLILLRVFLHRNGHHVFGLRENNGLIYKNMCSYQLLFLFVNMSFVRNVIAKTVWIEKLKA
jgi:hypothetical protein